MDVAKLLWGKPVSNLFSRDEPRLRGVELIENVEEIPFVAQFSPVGEILVKRQETKRQTIERVNRHVEEAGKHRSHNPDGPARQFVQHCAFHPF